MLGRRLNRGQRIEPKQWAAVVGRRTKTAAKSTLARFLV
jgi:hypothetical protein